MSLAIPPEEAEAKANTLLEWLASAYAELDQLQLEQDKEIEAVIATRRPRVEELLRRIEIDEAGLVDLWEQHKQLLTKSTPTRQSKTAKLVAGTISERLGSEALVIPDEAALERYLRRIRQWRTHSRYVGRKLDKSSVKKDRALVEAAPEGLVSYERTRTLHYTPAKLKIEKKRVLPSLRIRLGARED